jgi:small conductance mechanosensitive channel
MKEMEWLDKGREWLMTKGPDFIVNLVAFFLILIVGAIFVRTIRRVLGAFLQRSKRVDETLEKFLINVTGKALWVVVLMVALPRLGVDIAPLVAGLGVTGFIVGFAFQESLGNLAAGIMIILNRPYVVGDFINAAGHLGTVSEVNMMATTLNTPDNQRVLIPNSSIWGGPVINVTANDTRRVDMTVGIGYGEDIGRAREVALNVLKAEPKVLAEPAPVIEVVEMADSSVNLVVRPWSKTEHYWDVYFGIMRSIKEAYDREGIEIPFPQMDVHHDQPKSV